MTVGHKIIDRVRMMTGWTMPLAYRYRDGGNGGWKVTGGHYVIGCDWTGREMLRFERWELGEVIMGTGMAYPLQDHW